MTLAAMLASSRPPDGFDPPGLEIFETQCLIGSGDYCLKRISALMLLGALIVIGMFLAAFLRPKLVPKRFQSLMESGVEFVRDEIALAVIGREGLPWVPFLTAMFFSIFVWNIFGIVPPFQLPATSRMAIPLFLALLVWVLFNIAGLKAQGPRYFANVLFPPGVPKALYLLLTPIEFVSTFLVRPLTLSVRLLANMMAGHLILSIFFLGSAYLLAKPSTIPFAIPAMALSWALVAFELLVAFLQAYIFTILTAVYIGGSIHPEH